MTAVNFISWNELKFERKKSRKSIDFIKNPNERLAGGESGQSGHEKDPNDLYNALRPFLVFGRFIGLVPIQGLFQRDADKLTFK